ncbi:hypothetical protein CDA63_15635 [Hymenobacter amundsenii]|uniref:DUF2314 domain-containing protein n=1 Tax=Hymenobacter amundsenii TaxID=2006685 RepID=A0A246FI09_9BACT|nr:DUF2314 domain-containing protein [Hymenobacter amundsenii]OWP62163.1 hypothetical protein CDA63_15635 [Hymenobacter amundsenii]
MFLKTTSLLPRVLLAGSLLLSNCSSAPDDKVERAGEPTIYNVEAEDPEMQMAMKQGKATFPQFMAAIAQPDSTITNPAIKVPYEQDGQTEFLWLTDPTIEHGTLYGIIGNKPEYTNQVKEGDKVVIDTTLMADWNYVQHNRLIGGYTVKLLRNRMSAEERADFDESTGWDFGQ